MNQSVLVDSAQNDLWSEKRRLAGVHLYNPILQAALAVQCFAIGWLTLEDAVL